MVSARKFVTGKVGTIVIISGLIIGGAILAKKFNVGSKIISDVQGLGSITGQAIIAPFTGLVTGVNLGGQGLATQLGAAGSSLFNQGGIATDQFNRLIHPDWYNPDGSYSKANPKYGKLTSSLVLHPNTPIDTSQPGPLPATTPQDPVNPATQNTIPTVSQLQSSVPVNNFRFNNGSSLTYTVGTSPAVGSGAFTFNGKPLIPGAVARTTAFGVGTLTTVVGGTRQIIGSSGLFARLQSNLAGK